VNDAVFGVLTLTVVLPALGAAAAWVYGFRRHASAPAPRA
jgi:hydroxylaminobenzene mutase